MENSEVEKSKAFTVAESLEYVQNSVNHKAIVKKITGNVMAISFDTGQGLPEKICPFDTFIQIIDGRTEIAINSHSHWLETGQSIIVPAHSRQMIKAGQRFKILATIIKSGYEE